MAAAQKKGPAETAISPSRGSTDPREGMEMNEHSNITAAADTASVSLHGRINDLSEQLADALAEWHDFAGIPHTYVAYVPSSKIANDAYYMLNQPWRAGSAEERLEHHAKEFAKAAKEIDPTAEVMWRGNAVPGLPGGPRFSVIVSAKQGDVA